MNLDTIWERFEDFCKLQSNEVQAWLDLLTSFHQGSKNINKWYNAVQVQVNLTRYPPETAKMLHQDIFWFFLHDVDFMSRTITEEVLIWTSSLPVEFGSWQNILRAQRPLHIK